MHFSHRKESRRGPGDATQEIIPPWGPSRHALVVENMGASTDVAKNPPGGALKALYPMKPHMQRPGGARQQASLLVSQRAMRSCKSSGATTARPSVRPGALVCPKDSGIACGTVDIMSDRLQGRTRFCEPPLRGKVPNGVARRRSLIVDFAAVQQMQSRSGAVQL